MSQIPITELEFISIKEKIKNYFVNRPEFGDWNFEGSGLNFLIDVLAYNTQINALNAHISLNEAFLNSAQLRNNVVSHSKLLGYVPRSTIASSTTINVEVPAIDTENPELTLTMQRGHKFKSTNNNQTYFFLVTEDVNSQNYNEESQTYTFNNVEIKEGTLKQTFYRVDNSLGNQRFEIPENNVDITTIKVFVLDSEGNSETPYVQYDTLSGLDETSLVYFIQESLNNTYEIYFGDNTIGVKPDNGSIVKVEYIYSSGPEANGIRSFTNQTAFDGNPFVTVSANSPSSGGSDPESTESIRFNAPLSFVTQERAVTADDYKTIIRKNFGNIQTISVWGGENEPVPKYGKVYICIKPTNADFLTSSEKTQITNVLRGKNIVTITPEFINPDYTRLKLELFFKYNPKITSRSLSQINNLIRTEVENYNNDVLNQFDGVFRYSNFLRRIDEVDPGVLNSFVRIYLQKTFTPILGGNSTSEINFAGSLYVPSERESIITSSKFNIGGIQRYFKDEIIQGSGLRDVYLYTYDSGSFVKGSSPIGYLDSRKGVVTINNLVSDNLSPIKITALPNSYNIAPLRNQLVDIDLTQLTIDGEVDTIATAGSSGANEYNTFPRFK